MAYFDLSNSNFQKNKSRRAKIWGISLISVCALVLIFALTNIVPIVKDFLLGVFGLSIYPLSIIALIVGIALVNNKKYVMPFKYVLYLATVSLVVLMLVNIIVLGNPNNSFADYLIMTYNYKFTGGGLFAGVLLAPFLKTIGLAGTIIILAVVLVVFVALIADFLHSIKTFGYEKNKAQKNVSFAEVEHLKKEESKVVEEPKKKEKPHKVEEFNLFIDEKLQEKQINKSALIKLGLLEGNLESEKAPKKEMSIREQLLTPMPIDLSYIQASRQSKQKKAEINHNIDILKSQNQDENKARAASFFTPSKVENDFEKGGFTTNTTITNNFASEPKIYDSQPSEEKPAEVISPFGQAAFERSEPKPSIAEFIKNEPQATASENNFNPFSSTSPAQDTEEKGYFNSLQNATAYAMPEPIKDYSQTPTYRPIKKFVDFETQEPYTANSASKQSLGVSEYKTPPLELLENVEVDLSSLNENVVGKRALLENTLETFGVNAKCIGVVVGPSVTRYELEMPVGVSVKKILNLEDDIAMAMASRAGVRIEAPIPGKSAVGIEVPNDKIAMVTLREIFESREFQDSKRLTFALGKDIGGEVKVCDLTKMPHLLVAGATNSGKSICLNTIILSLIYKNSPDDLRLILVDPKRVEFSLYSDLPHLLIPSIITEVDKATNALTWAINEMERRYELLQMARCRKFEEFNQMPEILSGEQKKLPYIVIVVDELADLMSTNKKDLEEKIKRLAQKGRAAGIHLVLATQRPSVDVITGTIKANFPSRISFALTSFADSKTILDQGGAESLLGKGDMLYFPTDETYPKRIQGCYVSNQEVDNIVEFIKENTPCEFDEEIEKQIDKEQVSMQGGNYEGVIGDPNFDPILPQVLKMFIENKQASTSAIQRRFLAGFPRASRILDQLQQMGYVSAPDGTKPRSVLITMEEFYEKFGHIE